MEQTSTSGGFLPEELEFFAEDVTVSIVPNFSLSGTENSSLKCITGTFGPFHPNIPTNVPLWMALALHKRRKCRIVPPTWLSVDNLTDLLDRERNTAAVFQEVPFQYVEIFHLLTNYAKDCFGEDHYKVRDLVESLRKVRFNKIDAGLQILRGPLTVKLNNLSAMECNIIRPFFQKSLDRFYKLSKMEKQGGTDPEPQPSSRAPARNLRR